MRVVELFDVQEKSFDSPELLPFCRFKSCYRFLRLRSQLKGTIPKSFMKKMRQPHVSMSLRFLTINFL